LNDGRINYNPAGQNDSNIYSGDGYTGNTGGYGGYNSGTGTPNGGGTTQSTSTFTGTTVHDGNGSTNYPNGIPGAGGGNNTNQMWSGPYDPNAPKTPVDAVTITNVFTDIMGRAPTQDYINAVAGSGIGITDLRTALMSSPEYLSKQPSGGAPTDGSHIDGSNNDYTSFQPPGTTTVNSGDGGVLFVNEHGQVVGGASPSVGGWKQTYVEAPETKKKQIIEPPGSGLVNTYDSTNYNAVTQPVDPNGLLKNQIPAWLDPDSDTMRRMRTISQSNSNASGLLNSNFANQDALVAMLEKAGEYGQFDATQYTNRSDLNLGYENDANKTNAVFDNESKQFNASAQNALMMQQQAALDAQKLQHLTDTGKMAMIALEGDIQSGITDATLLSNQLIAAMDNAASIKSSSISAGATVSSASINATASQNVAKINGELDVINTQTKGAIDSYLSQLDFTEETSLTNLQGSWDAIFEKIKTDGTATQQFMKGTSDIITNTAEADELVGKLSEWFKSTSDYTDFKNELMDDVDFDEKEEDTENPDYVDPDDMAGQINGYN